MKSTKNPENGKDELRQLEIQYRRISKFLKETPHWIADDLRDGLDDPLSRLANSIVECRNPKTLDDIRAWRESDGPLIEVAITFLVDKYADEVHGYHEYALLPCDEWPEDYWCPDGYNSMIDNCGWRDVLALTNLHTTADLIQWLDETAELQESAL